MKMIFALILMCSFVALADMPGQKVAVVCAACHGEKGLSSNPLWPNLAGQKQDYLIKQLTAFQSGERKDPLMSPISMTLSKEDIENVAAYFSQMKP